MSEARPSFQGPLWFIMDNLYIGKYANILMDRWFKRAFKEYGNARRLMLLFLQALIPERQIVSIDYASEESTNQNPDGRSIRVDVECCDSDGR